MKKIDDLSFSGITDLIQGEEIKGADILVNIALEKEELEAEIEQVQNKLHQLKTRRDIVNNGANHVLKHLEKKAPLAVQRTSFIVVVTDKNISIERNVM
jgi:hypothetical protein